MAIRVRKLAKDLQRTPSEILGILATLGHERYQSAEDMLPDALAGLVKVAARRGVQPAPRPELAAPPPPPPRPRGLPAPSDLMGALVPGVVPVRGRSDRPAARSEGPPLRVVRSEEPVRAPVVEVADHEQAHLEAQRREVAAERAENEATRRLIASERHAVVAERAALEAEQAAVAAERAVLDADKARWDADLRRQKAERDLVLADPGGVSVVSVLQGRGLSGPDEMERALGALASARALRDVLPRLRVDDPQALAALLRDKLVLVGSVVPDGALGAVATVVVAPQRAEVASLDAVRRDVTRLGELLLLHGLRRLVLVGGRPLWHRVLREHIDPRIEVRLVAGRTRTAEDAASDVARADLVVLWGVEAEPAADRVYGTSRATVVRLFGEGPSDLVRAVEAALHEA